LILESNLMFWPKLDSMVRIAGHVPVRYTANKSIPEQAGYEGARIQPVVAVVNLEDPADPMKAIAAMRREDICIIAFCGHANADMMEQAAAAGAQIVLPRSAVDTRLPHILADAVKWQPDPDCDHC
jgi:AmiR/NasT family two-component response regulator